MMTIFLPPLSLNYTAPLRPLQPPPVEWRPVNQFETPPQIDEHLKDEHVWPGIMELMDDTGYGHSGQL